ncbi:hypothetical protein MSAN_02432600 [Mycena sanguinolenta]|uniref:Uncharacterized protein n=1 Tax=Mycena sanguinolenta TaxID=230812 RepID=A0A8H6X1X5_9AGAR|nr:hypothetical protein MSAN_02432600 [Mycena sanguinolenta]
MPSTSPRPTPTHPLHGYATSMAHEKARHPPTVARPPSSPKARISKTLAVALSHRNHHVRPTCRRLQTSPRRRRIGEYPLRSCTSCSRLLVSMPPVNALTHLHAAAARSAEDEDTADLDGLIYAPSAPSTAADGQGMAK